MTFNPSRRELLRDSILLSTAGAVSVPLLDEFLLTQLTVESSGKHQTASEKAKSEKEPEVTATEDLMREHGVIRRALLVYYEEPRGPRRHHRFPRLGCNLVVLTPPARVVVERPILPA